MVSEEADDAWRKRPCWSCWGGAPDAGVNRAGEAESLGSRMAGTVEHEEGTNQAGGVVAAAGRCCLRQRETRWSMEASTGLEGCPLVRVTSVAGLLHVKVDVQLEQAWAEKKKHARRPRDEGCGVLLLGLQNRQVMLGRRGIEVSAAKASWQPSWGVWGVSGRW